MYPFKGNHYLSSFLECDPVALCNVDSLREALVRGIKASGATLLNQCEHLFDGQACTMVFLLSESHCSIHTYPEHGAIFIDLFTCGDTCNYIQFEEIMKQYLQPVRVVSNVVMRGQDHVIQ